MSYAVFAYEAGSTGAGVSAAIIDTGIAADNPEFAGRILAASQDVAGNRGIQDQVGHGTSVAAILGAARNDAGIHGVAYGASLLVLRTDSPGNCGGSCGHALNDVARAIDIAVTNGARVINLSLGGVEANQQVIDAIGRAANAGIVTVIAAGNSSSANPDPFAMVALNPVSKGLVIIAGATNQAGVSPVSFTNKAGIGASQYLMATGETMHTIDQNGNVIAVAGTSFSTPVIAGAVALLAGAFPNLSGKEIVDILLTTARDTEAPGVDAIAGHGVLDLRKAFQPSGATTLAGGTAAVTISDPTGTGAPAIGDALSTASLPAIVLDQYSRAFETDLAGTLRGAQPARRLAASIGGQSRTLTFGSPMASLAFAIDNSDAEGQAPRLAQLRVSRDEAAQARVLSARVTAQINPKLRLGLGYREQANGLAGELQGQAQAAFMVAPAAGNDTASLIRPASALALRQRLGPWGLTATAEQGEIVSSNVFRQPSELTDRRRRGAVASYSLAFDRSFGPLEGALGLTMQLEADTVLGGRFHDAFGVEGAESLFLDAKAGWSVAPRWRLGVIWREGFSRARKIGLVASGSDLESRAWTLDLTREGVFAVHDTLGLRVSQPLRVESGALNLSLPTAWSYDTLTPSYAIERLGLTPQGREMVGELAWNGPLLGGSGSASLFYRRDPGHYEKLPDDKGMALRWNMHL